ncbi:hypothetical protein KIN20_036050 [Parelaphostrongylus tenuis]|uniref:Uncharacterized protein n=1 Tax=Parelaphostrongylus tenuis TaxID=148309 RepID=A0AAD5WKX6_PARTN|nr:hypothetical protein KIN20_036050 [Parelaphostrongylus tenuis]
MKILTRCEPDIARRQGIRVSMYSEEGEAPPKAQIRLSALVEHIPEEVRENVAIKF